MAVEILDTLGLKCPQPVLKIAVRAPDMKPGDILEVLGDCPTFEKDVRTYDFRCRKNQPLLNVYVYRHICERT